MPRLRHIRRPAFLCACAAPDTSYFVLRTSYFSFRHPAPIIRAPCAWRGKPQVTERVGLRLDGPLEYRRIIGALPPMRFFPLLARQKVRLRSNSATLRVAAHVTISGD